MQRSSLPCARVSLLFAVGVAACTGGADPSAPSPTSRGDGTGGERASSESESESETAAGASEGSEDGARSNAGGSSSGASGSSSGSSGDCLSCSSRYTCRGIEWSFTPGPDGSCVSHAAYYRCDGSIVDGRGAPTGTWERTPTGLRICSGSGSECMDCVPR